MPGMERSCIWTAHLTASNRMYLRMVSFLTALKYAGPQSSSWLETKYKFQNHSVCLNTRRSLLPLTRFPAFICTHLVRQPEEKMHMFDPTPPPQGTTKVRKVRISSLYLSDISGHRTLRRNFAMSWDRIFCNSAPGTRYWKTEAGRLQEHQGEERGQTECVHKGAQHAEVSAARKSLFLRVLPHLNIISSLTSIEPLDQQPLLTSCKVCSHISMDYTHDLECSHIFLELCTGGDLFTYITSYTEKNRQDATNLPSLWA